MTALTLTVKTAAVTRCRMLNSTSDRCTAEALDPQGEVLICQRHAALVMELVRARLAKVRP